MPSDNNAPSDKFDRLYALAGQHSERLVQIEERIKNWHELDHREHQLMLQRINEMSTHADRRITHLEDRVRKLEQWRWYLVGGMAVLFAVVAFFADVIKEGISYEPSAKVDERSAEHRAPLRFDWYHHYDSDKSDSRIREHPERHNGPRENHRMP